LKSSGLLEDREASAIETMTQEEKTSAAASSMAIAVFIFVEVCNMMKAVQVYREAQAEYNEGVARNNEIDRSQSLQAKTNVKDLEISKNMRDQPATRSLFISFLKLSIMLTPAFLAGYRIEIYGVSISYKTAVSICTIFGIIDLICVVWNWMWNNTQQFGWCLVIAAVALTLMMRNTSQRVDFFKKEQDLKNLMQTQEYDLLRAALLEQRQSPQVQGNTTADTHQATVDILMSQRDQCRKTGLAAEELNITSLNLNETVLHLNVTVSNLNETVYVLNERIRCMYELANPGWLDTLWSRDNGCEKWRNDVPQSSYFRVGNLVYLAVGSKAVPIYNFGKLAVGSAMGVVDIMRRGSDMVRNGNIILGQVALMASNLFLWKLGN
jgi:hypothetical protein